MPGDGGWGMLPQQQHQIFSKDDWMKIDTFQVLQQLWGEKMPGRGENASSLIPHPFGKYLQPERVPLAEPPHLKSRENAPLWF